MGPDCHLHLHDPDALWALTDLQAVTTGDDHEREDLSRDDRT